MQRYVRNVVMLKVMVMKKKKLGIMSYAQIIFSTELCAHVFQEDGGR